MELNTNKDIQNAYFQLEEEEKLIEKRIECYMSKQYQLEAMLRSIAQSVPKLQEICEDADKLSKVIHNTATLAETVSEKVRRLDITRSRVSECQQRVHDLLDLQLCSQGVQMALKNEDFEKAAAHVHRFLLIDQEILKQTAADFSEDQTLVDSSFSLLQEVTEKLRGVVARKINEAIVDEDLASVERFFKIYPLLDMHEEGIAKYAQYLSTKLKETSKKNLKIAIDTNRYEQKPNIIFADTLNSLLEGSARIIETCQPLVDTYYGPDRMISFIRHLQGACDDESGNIISELMRARQIEKKIRQVREYENNVKAVEKLDAKSLGPLLSELTNMHAKTELYFKFLRRRILSITDESLASRQKNLKEIDVIVEKSSLSRKMQEVLGYYVSLERYFLEESVNKAITMDTLQEGDNHLSSMVDDVFFIVTKAIRRSCSSGSLEGVCTVLNNVCRLIETEYCSALKQQLRHGYPSGYLDLTQAYNAFQQGRLQTSDPEQTKLTFLAYLNDADVSLEYTETLKKRVEDEIASNFPMLTDKEKEKVSICLSGLTEVLGALSAVIDYGMKQLKDSAIKPRVSPWISSFLDRNYELNEEELNNYESSETFMQQLIGNIGPFLVPFKESLTQNNYDIFVNVLTAEIVKQLEKVLMKSRYNRLGGLVVDRELRGINSFLATFTSWSIHEKFTRLNYITLLLNLERPAEMQDLECVGNTPLTSAEIKRVLKRRTDFSSEEVDALKL